MLVTVGIMRTRKAFTLIELVVTIVIAGILISVGVVSYSFLNDEASATQAESLLDRVAVAQQVAAQDYGYYVTCSKNLGNVGNDVRVLDPSSPASATGDVSIAVNEDGYAAAAAISSDNVCLARVIAPIVENGEMESLVLEDGQCTAQNAFTKSSLTETGQLSAFEENDGIGC